LFCNIYKVGGWVNEGVGDNGSHGETAIQEASASILSLLHQADLQ